MSQPEDSIVSSNKIRMSAKAQNRLIALCWAVYTISYLGRYSFSSNITNIMERFGVSHSEAGLVTTFFFFAYGAGQFINGLLCRRYRKEIVFPAVLAVASLANVLIFAGVPFASFKYIWLVNGLVQSALWSSIINILADNLDEKHLKTSLVVLGSTTAAGTFITYFASFLFSHVNMFMLIFPFAAVIMLSVAAVWAIFYRKTCSDIKNNTPEFTESRQDGSTEPAASGTGRFTKTMIATVAVFALFAVICNFLKDGLQTWVPGMLKEIYNLGDSSAILVSLILPLLSAFCGIFTLFANKYIKNITLLTTVFFTVCLLFTFILKLLINVSYILSAIIFGLIAFMSHSINTCITVILPLDFKGTNKSGMLAGILNGCCYAGSTVSAYGLGSAADTFGWDSAFMIFIAVSGAAAALGTAAFFALSFKPKKQ